ncbi:hypothetical protein SO802_013055 [Lithocarpus litseifolius]|uniref:PGG domain-containing protein n=1 Tax=Lithocarpus litseifolius TaxID=425828 RepID=A0AAW2D5Z2_9ROSI
MDYTKGPELYKVVAGKEKWRPLGPGDPKLRQCTVGRNTILHLAVNYGEKEVAKQILNLDQSLLNETNDKGDTPLHIAARLGDVEMATLLVGKMEKQDVEHGMKHLTIENKDDGKDTTLHVAVRNGHLEMVKLLIEKYPSLASKTNKANESPLFMAVDREYYNIAYEILKLQECSTKGRHMMNALHAAVIRTHKYFVDELMKKCDPKDPDMSGWIPLHYAAHWGDVELVKLFLKHDKSLAYCMTGKEGMTALHISARNGHVSVMKALIDDCPDICELVNKEGRTALHLAVESGKLKPVSFLLRSNEFKNLINEQDDEGNTALHLAATRGYVLTTRRMSHSGKIDRMAMNSKDMTTLDILRSITQKNILLCYHIGYLPSLEEAEKEEHTIETKEQGYDQVREIRIEDAKNMMETSRANMVENDGGNPVPTNQKNTQEADQKEDKYKRSSETFLLIATIISTVTFQAAFQVPGAYNSEVAFFPQRFRVPYPRLLILLVSEFSLTFMISAFMSALNTQHSIVASVAGYGAYSSFLLPFCFIVSLYAYFFLKSVSKYRFPFFPSKYLSTSH